MVLRDVEPEGNNMNMSLATLALAGLVLPGAELAESGSVDLEFKELAVIDLDHARAPLPG
jgi:hypothetical protein